MSDCFLGFDIGGTSVKSAVLMNDKIEVLGNSAQYARPDALSLRQAISQAREALDELEFDAQRVTRVGLCAPGLFDDNTGRFAGSVNVPGLVGLSLDELATSLGCTAPIQHVTDAYAAAYDIRCLRTLPHGMRLLALSLGTGVGACVLDGDGPLLISGRSSGHIGQWDVSIDSHPIPLGPDGGRGGLEAYIGLPALCSQFKCTPDELPQHIAALNEQSLPLRALARAIRIAHAVYRPDAICLLGGVGLCLKPVGDVLDSMVGHELTCLAKPGVKITFGEHSHHAACGAARLAARAV